jgi:hypothetical protein
MVLNGIEEKLKDLSEEMARDELVRSAAVQAIDGVCPCVSC